MQFNFIKNKEDGRIITPDEKLGALLKLKEEFVYQRVDYDILKRVLNRFGQPKKKIR